MEFKKKVYFQTGRDFDSDRNVSVINTRNAVNIEAYQIRKKCTTYHTHGDNRGIYTIVSVLRNK